ncbi:hypothetical protein cypCar_00041673, partial [Cyprinus carpio]
LLSEKISGAEGTKLDEDFMEMERKIEVTNKSLFELVTKTTEYLQPNPASRAKLGMLNTVSKMRGQVKTTGYPQTEGLLGDCMLRYGQELGEESTFGTSAHTDSQTHACTDINHRLTVMKSRCCAKESWLSLRTLSLFESHSLAHCAL